MKKQKILIVGVGAVVIITLTILLVMKLGKPKVEDVNIKEQETQTEDIIIKEPETVIVPQIEDTTNEVDAEDKTGEQTTSGTNQTIQPDVEKPPKPTEEQLTNKEEKPTNNTGNKPKPPSGGETNNSGQIYVPGFGWIDNQGGGGEGTIVDGDGDINNQVGTMD